MKKRTSLAVLVLALILMLAGCSSVRQKILGSNDMNLTYVGIASDGSHRYTSDVGELTWLEGKIDLDGKRFGVVSGRSGDFTFEDGRTLTAAGCLRHPGLGERTARYRGEGRGLSGDPGGSSGIPGGVFHHCQPEYGDGGQRDHTAGALCGSHLCRGSCDGVFEASRLAEYQ